MRFSLFISILVLLKKLLIKNNFKEDILISEFPLINIKLWKLFIEFLNIS